MREPADFAAFCQMLHQDAFLTGSSIDEAAQSCLRSLSAPHRAELRSYLEELLATRTGAELKGVLNRHVPDHSFSAASARELLRAALNELTRDISG
jgi:hypothetical protein